MAKYCKAYAVKAFKDFPDWVRLSQKIKKEKKIQAGSESWVEREFADNDYVYLHENYVVTDGIFTDKNIIFAQVTSEWKEFCTRVLKFQIPDYQTPKP